MDLTDSVIVLLALAATFVFFILDWLRYDVVSLGTLLFLTIVGIIPYSDAFSGFSHPAVVTLVSILIVSRGLQNSWIVERVSEWIDQIRRGPTVQLLFLCTITAILSAFINNIGALAVTMPVTIRSALRRSLSPSIYLMPVAFSSLLGGLTTLIGTPPNIIISGFREQITGEPFGLFDYTPVGLPVSIIGVVMMAVIGWRLLPSRKKASGTLQAFEVGDYTAEVVIPSSSRYAGKNLSDLQTAAHEELSFLVISGKEGRRKSIRKNLELKVGDTLVVEGPPEAINHLLSKTGLEMASADERSGNDESLVEAVVCPNSQLLRRRPRAETLSRRFGITLLAVARQGRKLRKRFSQIKIKVGDVLLLRGDPEQIGEMLSETDCLPLASRDVSVGFTPNILLAPIIFIGSVALIFTGLLPAHLSLPLAALLMVGSGIVPAREVYHHIDWSIVVLLGALLPVGKAMESSGLAELLVTTLISFGKGFGPELLLGVLLVSVMFVSDLINNAAAAALSAPLAVRMAETLDVSPDPFLMAVAIGASCAFLTPIGHQSNTLVLGPGGYRFSDYWKLGLPLEVLIVLISLPALLYFWPL